MSDLRKYITKRKLRDPEFANNFVAGYEEFKIGSGSGTIIINLSSRHLIFSYFRFSLYSLLSPPFRYAECHSIKSCEENIMPLTEPDL